MDKQSSQLERATENLLQLLQNSSIPESTRTLLKSRFEEVEALYERLCEGTLQIAVFGRVSSGKSSLLNALLGVDVFEVSPIHGSTKKAHIKKWSPANQQQLILIDTPGINEINGEEREQLARDVASRSDLIIFVADGDLTQDEFIALGELCALNRPVLLALNKVDRHDAQSIQILIKHLIERTHTLLPEENIIPCSARPTKGQANTRELKTRLWDIVQSQGKSLLALNASLFADQLSKDIGQEIVETRKQLSDQIIRNWSLGKGVAVAVNPIPLADLFAAASMDIGLIVHLSHIYGLSMSKSEATKLILTISAQLTVLMSAVWGVNLASSALKTASAGLSTAITAGTQGGLAYYATYVVGRAAQHYFSQGGHWGKQGSKVDIKEILTQLDKNAILTQAKQDIRQKVLNK